MKGLLIDTLQGEQVHDPASNFIYTPETNAVGGSVATGGSITVDSLSLPQPAAPSVSFFLSDIVANAGELQGENAELVINFFGTKINAIASGTSVVDFSNVSGAITTLNDMISQIIAGPYSNDTWTSFPGSDNNWEVRLTTTSGSETLDIRYNENTFDYNNGQIELKIDHATLTDYSATKVLTGGVGSLSSTIQLDLGATPIATITEGAEYNSGDDVDTVMTALTTAINALTDYTPDGASYNAPTNTLTLSTTTNTSSYNDKLPDVVSNISPDKASIPFTIEYVSPSAGTIDFQIGNKTLSVTIDGTEIDDAEVGVKIQTAMANDATWNYEYNSAKIIAKTNGTAFNGTMYVITDTGLTFNIDGATAQNDTTFVLSGGRDSIITTSSPIAMTGGSSPVTALTDVLTSIKQARKGSIGNNEIRLDGFLGYILINEFPASVPFTQDAILQIGNNILSVGTDKGLGFQDLFKSIGNSEPYYHGFLRVLQNFDGTNRRISNNVADYLWFKIWRSAGGYINISRITARNPFKVGGTGFDFDPASEVVLVDDTHQLASPAGKWLDFTYAKKGANAIQFTLCSNAAGNVGGALVSTVITSTENAEVTSIVNLLEDRNWVEAIAANNGANIILGKRNVLGD